MTEAESRGKRTGQRSLTETNWKRQAGQIQTLKEKEKLDLVREHDVGLKGAQTLRGWKVVLGSECQEEKGTE